MRYYPVVRNWSRKIKPHLFDPKVVEVLVRDFNRFTLGRWEKPFLAGMKPTDFESRDWRCDRRGRQPEFWDYCKHAALPLDRKPLPPPSRARRSQAFRGGLFHRGLTLPSGTAQPTRSLRLQFPCAWSILTKRGKQHGPRGTNTADWQRTRPCHMAEHWQSEMQRSPVVALTTASAKRRDQAARRILVRSLHPRPFRPVEFLTARRADGVSQRRTGGGTTASLWIPDPGAQSPATGGLLLG